MRNDFDESNVLIPKITIGIPVYNGEKFIKRAIDSILSQTYTNFKLIISDNGSTDSTSIICKDYQQKDGRIQYIKQEKNMGWFFNFKCLLDLARSEYFVWIADDDYWKPSFLEENIKKLDLKPNIVASTGIIEYLTESKEVKTSIQKFKDKLRDKNKNYKSYRHVASVSGPYFKKAKYYLRFNQASFVYGVFRTEKLRQRWVSKLVSPWDLILLLNILKEGDFDVIEKVLMYRPSSGVRGMDSRLKMHQQKIISTVDLFIPSFSFSFWCLKNIGKKFFIKNADWFTMLTIYGWYSIIKK